MTETIFSPRLLQILKELSKTEHYVSANDLASALGVSSRTIFREIQTSETLLKPYNISLSAKAGYGFIIEGEDEAVQRLIKTLESSYNQLVYRNVEERRRMLMIECLQRRHITKLSVLASSFDVSEGTISRDLDAIEPWFDDYNLSLIRKQGYGVEIEGEEDQIRKAITDFVHSQLQHHEEALYNSQRVDVRSYFREHNSGILGLLNKDVVMKVIDVLENSSISIATKITQYSYIGLIIHLAVAVERIRNGDAIVIDPKLLASLKSTPMVKEAKIIAGDIGDRFGIVFPEAEIGYILMHLRGTRPRYLNETDDAVASNYDCMIVAENLIRRFSNLTGQDFTGDESLLAGLTAHLQPTLNRLYYQLEIRNPLLDEIKGQYLDLFEIVKNTCEILYLENNYHLSDDEVGYLTLHFGAAIERKKLQTQTASSLVLGVVCASGIGISALLASKIKSTFLDAKAVVPLSVETVEAGELPEIDLLISTLDLTIDMPTVYVNPLLRDEDILAIRYQMDKLKEERFVEKPKPLSPAYRVEIIERIRFKKVNLNEPLTTLLETLIADFELSSVLAETVLNEVLLREKRNSVVIADERFVMYHASVPGLKQPEVLFFKNHKENKKLDYDIGVLMIIPKPADVNERFTMSRISEAIIDHKALLNAVRNESVEGIRNELMNYKEERAYE